MKRLQMTPELSAMIKAAVGTDVDTDKLAVFETIALNTLPLPGKGGIFKGARTAAITLSEMVQHINNGGHLPLMVDHVVLGMPKGRVFHAGLNYSDEGLEMRQLFYLDETESDTIIKLDTGVMDEVSVQFLPREFTCSACGWDYIADGGPEHLANHTCENGHEIGEDGVYANLIGLDTFVETSLVARGAADKPKIVGRSESKLAPETILRLAARGFEPDALVVRASIREDDAMDTTKLVTDLTAATSQVAVLTHEKTQLTAQLGTATTERDAAAAKVTDLEGQVATLTSERDEALTRPEASVKTERDEAIAVLQGQFNGLRVALGEDKLEGDALPSTVAELKTGIDEMTTKLTAILPAPGGTSQAAGAGENGKTAMPAAAFSTRKN